MLTKMTINIEAQERGRIDEIEDMENLARNGLKDVYHYFVQTSRHFFLTAVFSFSFL